MKKFEYFFKALIYLESKNYQFQEFMAPCPGFRRGTDIQISIDRWMNK